MSHYEVLGVARGAPVAEIRQAYLKLARTHHPDFHAGAGAARRGEAERTMQRLNEAWLVLGDRDRRADYDRSLALSETGTDGWLRGTAHPDFVPFDPDDDPDGGEGLFAGFGDGEDATAGTGRRVPPWQQLLPAACLVAAIAVLSTAAVVGGRMLVALGVVLLVGAGVGFVLTPMLAVLRTYERDPGR